MTFKQKLIDHGYPKSLMENWDEAFCKQEWKVLSQYLPQAIKTTEQPRRKPTAGKEVNI